jgi:APA family basic amino acid/polyamine antiporter
MTEPTKSRPFGVWTATAMVVGTMIGSGIFVLPAQLAPYGWTGAAGWVVAGVGAMLIAVVLVELTRAMPEQPNMIAICGQALGSPTGVMIGWSYWVSVWSANAVVATTAARYLATFYPPAGATPLRVALLGTLIVTILTVINLRGARSVGRLQVATTVLKLVPLVAVVGLIAWLVLLGKSVSPANASEPFAWSGVSPAMGIAFFAVMGFESLSLVTERVRDPARNVLLAMLWGLGLTTLLYIVVCTGMAFASPTADLVTAQAPIAYFIEHYLGYGPALLVAAFAALAGIGYLNGATMLLGEMPLCAVRGGLLPGWLARTNDRDVAVAPLLVGTALCIALMLGAAGRSGGQVLEFMLKMTTVSTVLLYIGACAAALALGRMRVLALIGMAFALWVIWSVGLEAAAWGLGLTALGFPLWFLTARMAVTA